MYLFNGRQPAFFLAAFAQWVCRRIAVTDTFPSPTVLFVDVGRTLILVILSTSLRPVFLAVLSVTQVGTAGIGARALWLPWHMVHLASLYKKSSRDNPREPFLFSFPIIMIP